MIDFCKSAFEQGLFWPVYCRDCLPVKTAETLLKLLRKEAGHGYRPINIDDQASK
jgi:hypothetical protein